MLLGTDELVILRGSKFYGTWKWVNSVTGDAEDFAGLTARVKIKNIHEDFSDVKNTWEVGTVIVEPLDIDGNAFKGRVDIVLEKEDTLKFSIPLFEEDKYGASDYYAVLEITLNTGEVILQAKVKVVESLEAETLNILIDERNEIIVIAGKLDEILLRQEDFILQRDAYIQDLEIAQTEVSLQLGEVVSKHSQVTQMKSDVQALKVEVETVFDNFDDRYLGAKATNPTLDNDGDPLQVGQIYYSTIDKSLRFYNGTSWDSPVLSAQTYASSASISATTATAQAGTSTAKAIESKASATSASSSEANALLYRNQAQGFRDEVDPSLILEKVRMSQILNITGALR